MTAKTRIKVLSGYAAHAQFLAQCEDEVAGYLPRDDEIASPYAYSPTDEVKRFGQELVIVREARQRYYEVFRIEKLMTEDTATATCIASIKDHTP